MARTSFSAARRFVKNGSAAAAVEKERVRSLRRRAEAAALRAAAIDPEGDDVYVDVVRLDERGVA